MSTPITPTIKLTGSDGDGLPDLGTGWRTATNAATNLSADTDGDGFNNFIGDLIHLSTTPLITTEMSPMWTASALAETARVSPQAA